jgi:hypothetical protein
VCVCVCVYVCGVCVRVCACSCEEPDIIEGLGLSIMTKAKSSFFDFISIPNTYPLPSSVSMQSNCSIISYSNCFKGMVSL